MNYVCEFLFLRFKDGRESRQININEFTVYIFRHKKRVFEKFDAVE